MPIGVSNYGECTALLLSTVKRLDPAYKGPFDAQALIQYLEALVLQAREMPRDGRFATARRSD